MSLVFISYAHRDGADIAEAIYDTLTAAGCNPWMDVKHLQPGVDWDEEIDKALEDCAAVVVVVTPLAVNSISVKAEWKPAIEDGKLVIPVVRQPVRVPRYLRLFQWVDFSDGVDQDLALQALVERLGCQPVSTSAMMAALPMTMVSEGNGSFHPDDDAFSDEQRYAIELLKERKYLELIEWVNQINTPVENKTRATLLGLRAVAQDALGNAQDALDDLSEAIELKPDDPEFYVQRGELNVDLGKVREAFQDFEHALQLDPELKDLINIETAAVVTYVTNVDMLPMPLPESMHGRKALVNLVLKTFDDNRDVLLYGVGGIGKTAIATIVAQQFIERGSAVLWVNVGAANLELLLNAIGQELERALNSNEFRQAATLESKTQAILDILKTSKPLLVLDDAWNVNEMVELFKSMAANQLPVLVTTRRTDFPALPNVESISIEALPDDAAVELYRQYSPGEGDREAINQLNAWLNYHPLGIRLAATHAHYTRQNAQAMLALLQSQGAQNPILAAFDVVIKELSEPALAVFKIIGALPAARATPRFMALVVDQETETTAGILTALARRGLMGKTTSPDGQEFYAIHDLTYAYAHDLLGSSTDIHEAEQKVLKAGEPYIRQTRTLIELSVERATLLGLVDRAASFQDHEAVFVLADGLSNFLDYMGYLQDQRNVFSKALASSRVKHESMREVRYLRTLANTDSIMGQYQRALGYYQEALEIARNQGSKSEESGILSDLGNVYANLGEFSKAIELLQESLKTTQKRGDRKIEGVVLGNLGNAYLGLGQINVAIRYYNMAMAMRSQLSDRTVSVTLTNLGAAYAEAGRYGSAIAYLEEALTSSREAGDKRAEAIQLNNLGIIYANREEYNRAIDYYRQAGEIFREIGADNLSANVDELMQSALASRKMSVNDTRSINIQQNIDSMSGGVVIGQQINKVPSGQIKPVAVPPPEEEIITSDSDADATLPDLAHQNKKTSKLSLGGVEVEWWAVALGAIVLLVIVAMIVLIFMRPG